MVYACLVFLMFACCIFPYVCVIMLNYFVCTLFDVLYMHTYSQAILSPRQKCYYAEVFKIAALLNTLECQVAVWKAKFDQQ